MKDLRVKPRKAPRQRIENRGDRYDKLVKRFEKTGNRTIAMKAIKVSFQKRKDMGNCPYNDISEFLEKEDPILLIAIRATKPIKKV